MAEKKKKIKFPWFCDRPFFFVTGRMACQQLACEHDECKTDDEDPDDE